MTAEGDWTNLIVDVYLPRLLEGESYDSLREELKKFMADLDGFHPGSGPYVRLMDIFQQVMRSGSSEKKDKLLSGETREQYMERMKAQRERNNS
ncbi:hypothetical protein KJZ63_02655, partial [Patescibacteria group bacterium]|nr:hypothetical protein [Patescibacteria group bacterium]